MAIIKCPECGHEVSDKAPKCPSCGVEIAGRTIRCEQCGNHYFNDQPECPACHHKASHSTDTSEQDNRTAVGLPSTNRRKHFIYLTIGIVLTIVLICAGAWYFYTVQADKNAENNEYEYALSSDDTAILKKYLSTFPDAPDAHRDMIQKRLNKLEKTSIAWTDAAVSGSKTALKEFLENYPDSPYKDAAARKIDSIDWHEARQQNTIGAYETYMREQPNGEHFDEADEAIRSINTKTVQPEEEIMISSLFRSFFQSLNNKDEDALAATVSTVLTSFLGKTDATRADVITFMNKIYKSDVASMDWHESSAYDITKKEIGDQKYEYTVEFSAVQNVQTTNSNLIRQNFKIKAKVDPDGKITELNMVKILEH